MLQKQADSVREILNKNITGVAIANDNFYNLNPSLNIKGANSKKIQIDITANTEVLKQLIVQLELSKITLRKETPLIQLIDKPILPLKIEKYGKATSMIIGGLISLFMSMFFLVSFKIYSNLMDH